MVGAGGVVARVSCATFVDLQFALVNVYKYIVENNFKDFQHNAFDNKKE